MVNKHIYNPETLHILAMVSWMSYTFVSCFILVCTFLILTPVKYCYWLQRNCAWFLFLVCRERQQFWTDAFTNTLRVYLKLLLSVAVPCVRRLLFNVFIVCWAFSPYFQHRQQNTWKFNGMNSFILYYRQHHSQLFFAVFTCKYLLV